MRANLLNYNIMLLVLVGVFLAGPVRAQIPATDIWVARLAVEEGHVHIGVPRNVTARPGYDNQPAFLPDGSGFLFSAAAPGQPTDVWRWDAADEVLSRVTHSPESEYSPTPLNWPPGGFCAVRVEADSTQRLWSFDMAGDDARLVLADVDSVGYFGWIDPSTVAVFIVGDPNTLRIVDVPTQHETPVARHVGRFIRCIPGTRDLSFTARVEDGRQAFFVLPFEDSKPERLVDPPGDGQDAAWAGETLLATTASALYAARPFDDGKWIKVADLGAWGLDGVTRIAASPDMRSIAIVAAEPAASPRSGR